MRYNKWYEYNCYSRKIFHTVTCAAFFVLVILRVLSSVFLSSWRTSSNLEFLLIGLPVYELHLWKQSVSRRRSCILWNVFLFGIRQLGKYSEYKRLALLALHIASPYIRCISVISKLEWSSIIASNTILNDMYVRLLVKTELI